MKQNITLTKKSKSVKGTVQLTGSKSECNRALIIEALSLGKVTVGNVSDAADTVTLLEILRGQRAVGNGQLSDSENNHLIPTAHRFTNYQCWTRRYGYAFFNSLLNFAGGSCDNTYRQRTHEKKADRYFGGRITAIGWQILNMREKMVSRRCV